MIHFKDVFLCISHHAICNRFQLETLSITEKYVVKQLNKGWFKVFKSLKKLEIENKKRVNLNASQFLAMDVISCYTKKWKENRRQKQFQKTINQR